jgi:hypothetical protein
VLTKSTLKVLTSKVLRERAAAVEERRASGAQAQAAAEAAAADRAAARAVVEEAAQGGSPSELGGDSDSDSTAGGEALDFPTGDSNCERVSNSSADAGSESNVGSANGSDTPRPMAQLKAPEAGPVGGTAWVVAYDGEDGTAQGCERRGARGTARPPWPRECIAFQPTSH